MNSCWRQPAAGTENCDASTNDCDSNLSESCDSLEQCDLKSDANNPSDHLQQALQEVASEENGFATLTDRQYDVIDEMASDPDAWVHKVLHAVSHWSEEKVGHQIDLEAFHNSLTEDQKATAGKIDPFLLDQMVKTSRHVDHQYVKDFLAGFPVSGVVDAKGTRTSIEGGQLTHGRPAHGKMPVLDDLKSRCAEINERTLRMAQARIPKMRQEGKLAADMWEKIGLERSKGRISEPMNLDQFRMGEALLVDTFGVYEQHGQATEETLRVISNCKANEANGYASMTEKLHYDGFPELTEAAARLSKKQKATIDGCLRMGKADFKSAFKMLPVLLRRPMESALVFVHWSDTSTQNHTKRYK